MIPRTEILCRAKHNLVLPHTSIKWTEGEEYDIFFSDEEECWILQSDMGVVRYEPNFHLRLKDSDIFDTIIKVNTDLLV